MRSLASAAAIGLAAIVLGGCPEQQAEVGEGRAIKMDGFCEQSGLPPALRHTIILVDTQLIQKSTPETFRQNNLELFKLVIGLADPTTALESGASAPRERITILAGSTRGGMSTPVFTGCVPGATAAELERLGGAGATEQYFGSDLSSKLGKNQDEFRRQLLLSLMQLNKMGEALERGGDGTFSSSTLVRLLKPLGLPAADDRSTRRLFVLTDARKSAPPQPNRTDARAAGFAEAQKIGLRLGLAEVHFSASATHYDETTRDFLNAFVLGSQGDLASIGSFSANTLAAAPAKVSRYRGALKLTSTLTVPVELRLASTTSGVLVSSWISYTGSFGQRATPLKGQLTCSGEQDCFVRSDPEGGLGQLWRIAPGPEPEVREDAPLGGLRFLEAREDDRSLKGRIYDPIISIERPGGGMTFEAKRAA